MDAERQGLRKRYENVVANAAFSQQLVEDDRGSDRMSSKVDDMTGAMIRTTARIAHLQEQIDFTMPSLRLLRRRSPKPASPGADYPARRLIHSAL
jgi:hypothetical protein